MRHVSVTSLAQIGQGVPKIFNFKTVMIMKTMTVKKKRQNISDEDKNINTSMHFSKFTGMYVASVSTSLLGLETLDLTGHLELRYCYTFPSGA